MGERDFTTKRGRKAFREFCEKYGEELTVMAVELKVMAIRAGGMLAALDELGVRVKGIRNAARKFDENCEVDRRSA